MRLLETCRRLTESGYTEQEISNIINSNLCVFLDDLDESELSSWQVDDLRLFRSSISIFVKNV